MNELKTSKKSQVAQALTRKMPLRYNIPEHSPGNGSDFSQVGKSGQLKRGCWMKIQDFVGLATRKQRPVRATVTMQVALRETTQATGVNSP